MRIVVADDHEDGADMLASLLGLLGHETFVARSGPEAVQVCLDQLPRLAFIDFLLPGFDGIEVARRVRAALAHTAPFLVAVTGMARPALEQRAREAGYGAFLLKPYDVSRIESLIAGVG